MKWAVPELRRLNKPVTYDFALDVKDELIGFNGLKDISNVRVVGNGHEFDEGKFIFRFNVLCDLTMPCSISNEELVHHLDLDCEEIFAFDNEEDEDINLIDGQTIDLHDVIVTNIVVNIPMKVTKEGVTYTEEEDEDYINPAFASLKEYLK